MYKEFTRENLLTVQRIVYYRNGNTISLSTEQSSDKDAEIGLDATGEDSKIPEFNTCSFHFIVHLIERFTGYCFKPIRHDEHLTIFDRTTTPIESATAGVHEAGHQQPEPPKVNPKYRCRCGAVVTAVDQQTLRSLVAVHGLSCRR